jgi:hypothetical protein
MSSITFDGVPLVRPSFPSFDRSPITDVKVLISGKRSVQTSSELGFAVSFVCVTDTLTDISDLRAKIGAPYTLVIDGVNYTNCYIQSPWKEEKIDNNNWKYTVSFVRDTT